MFSNTGITTGSTGVHLGSSLFNTPGTNNTNTILTRGISNAYSLTNALNLNN